MNKMSQLMRMSALLVGAMPLLAVSLHAQSAAGEVEAILSQEIQPRQTVTLESQRYLLKRAPNLPQPSSTTQWSADAEKIRTHVLDDVVFHGWPKAWLDGPPKVEDLVEIPGGKGFRRWKLRYEVVPGMDATAILYAPDRLQGKLPGILVVMGHWEKLGNATAFNQKQCINYALRGAVVLNPNWVGMGELNRPGNQHWFAAHLDLVGANGVGLYYLAMRKALDYLYQNPRVDINRIGMTGLSGGGWQTIMLSSLDKRVHVSIPVAGYTTLAGRVERVGIGEPGDIEQNPTDFLVGQDYSTLTAMRAPRPTLLINNTGDNCCFRAPLVKSEIFDPIRRFFSLYGAEDAFQFHANTDDPAHNYGLDNRQQSYRFFIRYLGLAGNDREIQVGEDVKAYGELTSGVPQNNLTILGLARQLGSQIKRQPIPSEASVRAVWADSERNQLRDTVRYQPASVAQAWPVWNTWYKQVESISFRFQLSNGLSATGVWMKDVSTPKDATLTIELNDSGMKAASTETWNHTPEVADRLDRGEQVLALDVLFTGDAAPDQPASFTEMLAAAGDRPLGMEAAQLLAVAHWAQQNFNPPSLRIETTGIRSQVQALVAAALEPKTFSVLATYNGMSSLEYLLDKPVTYLEAPDLFCLDLYKNFDIDRLVSMTAPTRIIDQQPIGTVDRPGSDRQPGLGATIGIDRYNRF